MFGGYIMDLTADDKPTPIETIDRVLSGQEQAIKQVREQSGFSMVDVDRVATR